MLRWVLFFSILTSLAAQEQNVKICLLMLAKDQEAHIKDCLKSVEKIVDAVCIVDQASPYLSACIAEEWLEESKIPGLVILYDKSQGTPQEFAMLAARKLLEEFDFSKESTYFLLLDPDMMVRVSAGFQKGIWDKDSYLILQKSPTLGFSIYDLFLLRASLHWDYTDPVLGQWSCKEAGAPAKLKNIVIEGEKFNLDQTIKNLISALTEDPSNHRYQLYLAQCYKGKKDYEEAIRLYQKRIEEGGELEEIWFSTFMIGSCYEELGAWGKALTFYLEAFQMYPDRPDPIQKIATHCRKTGQNDIAYLFAKHGSLITRTLDQNFFSYPPLADYQFLEEISIAAYYTRHKEAGFLAASELLLRKNVPLWVKGQNERNIFYYVPNLKNAKYQSLRLSLPLIQQGLKERYTLAGASILKTDTGYKLICKAVNYTQTGGKIFHTVDPTGQFRTKNFLVSLDREFQVLKELEIIENLPRERFPAFNVEGLEDLRLFEYGGSDWFTCTTTDTNPTGAPQVSLCKLSNGSVEHLIPLLGPDPTRCEKNWLPFVHNDKLQLVYSYDPFVLMTPELDTGESKASIAQESHLDLSHFRGSAAPIPFDHGHLILIHEAVDFPDYTKRYLHRFLFLGPQFQIEKISTPFVFVHQGIEHCYGMTLDHSGTKLILTLSVEEREAYLCTLPTESVRAMLR
jgi:tetratricopeptide (TPR) repeat protein